MIPSRKFESIGPAGQPAIANIDEDDFLEILVPTDGGYLACFEWDADADSGRAERGWPQLFADLPLTPTIADIDATGNLELIVQDRSGWVHVFELLGTASENELPWSQYGHDPRNTFNAATSLGLKKEQKLPDDEAKPVEWKLRVGPNPILKGDLSISFELPRPGRVLAEVFDVGGRQVKTVIDERYRAGRYRVVWDGRGQQGTLVASGVYFLQVKAPERVDVRKIMVVR